MNRSEINEEIKSLEDALCRLQDARKNVFHDPPELDYLDDQIEGRQARYKILTGRYYRIPRLGNEK